MQRTKFSYNPETCKYEPYVPSKQTIRKQSIIFISLSFLLALGCYWGFIKYFGSLDEQRLTRKNLVLKVQWKILEERTTKALSNLKELAEKDDENYRVILDAEPLPTEVREAGSGGREKNIDPALQAQPHVLQAYNTLEKLGQQVEVEVQSYDELNKLLNKKISMWASRPAIQPISNKTLDRLHMSYGLRMHPIFHVLKDHKGLDFAAPKGTPVYATGDGQVAMAYFSGSYGNVIYINHGHHYETRYAHLSKFAVHAGEKVKRGQVIGYVGNTGNSKAPHLHYEVLFYGQHLNPINFFQQDLSNKEYEKLIEIGSKQNKALD